MGDSKMGLHARLMSQALRKLERLARLIVRFSLSIRERKLGETLKTTTGGNALKFYASVRLETSVVRHKLKMGIAFR
jgi:recombination protein RecA